MRKKKRRGEKYEFVVESERTKMPRGKNYVNQNRGMVLQGRQKVTEPCKYGSACNRKDCIYSHDVADTQSENAPCMAYLAGLCTFTKGCRRRHPPDDECERLRTKYGNLPCRYGPDCHTEGCLYNHDRSVPTKPTPPVCKAAPLAAWMPSGGSSITPPAPPQATAYRQGGPQPTQSTSYHQGGPQSAAAYHPQQQSYTPYYQGGPPAQPYPSYGYPEQPPMVMPGYSQAQPWYPPQSGPKSMIGSWKPAPIAPTFQPYAVPQAPSPPQGSWESQFPELPSNQNDKNNEDNTALDKSR